MKIYFKICFLCAVVLTLLTGCIDSQISSKDSLEQNISTNTVKTVENISNVKSVDEQLYVNNSNESVIIFENGSLCNTTLNDSSEILEINVSNSQAVKKTEIKNIIITTSFKFTNPELTLGDPIEVDENEKYTNTISNDGYIEYTGESSESDSTYVYDTYYLDDGTKVTHYAKEYRYEYILTNGEKLIYYETTGKWERIPKTGKKYVIVDISVYNNGYDEFYVNPIDFKLIADRTSYYYEGIVLDDELECTSLNSGHCVHGKIAYCLPEDAQLQNIKYVGIGDYNIVCKFEPVTGSKMNYNFNSTNRYIYVDSYDVSEKNITISISRNQWAYVVNIKNNGYKTFYVNPWSFCAKDPNTGAMYNYNFETNDLDNPLMPKVLRNGQEVEGKLLILGNSATIFDPTWGDYNIVYN
jgi:hypothetical protein